MMKVGATASWLGCALASPLLRLRSKRRPRWLSVLAYHRVLPSPGDDYPFDPAVIDCGPDEFDRHMRMVARECSPVGLDLVLDFLRGEADLPPNPVLVTFDDGYRDNHDHALPVLVRHRIPATFFVSSAYISDRRLFWWDRIAYLLHHARVSRVQLDYPTRLMLATRSPPALHAALRLVKSYPGLNLERFLEQLTRAAHVPWHRDLERRLADELILTWDQVRALRDAGMNIGSHTRSHRVLFTLKPSELADELAGSRADLERELQTPVRALSYPVGRTLRPLPALRRAVERAGYQAGFSTEPRANLLPDPLDRFDLARLPIDRGVSTDRLRLRLAAPELSHVW